MAATLFGGLALAARGEPSDWLLLFPQWSPLLTLHTGAGYKDNVFLSHTAPRGSAFVSGGAELLLLRLLPENPKFNFFANGEVSRFLSGPAEHTEATVFSQAQLEHDFNATWKGALAAQYFFQDQVLDVSISETNRQPVPVLGHTVSLRPSVRAALPRQFWLTLETPATRQFFDAPLDDYWEAGPKLTLGRSYGWNSQLSASYEAAWRPYDSDPARTATGAALTNTLRRRFQQDARLTWRHQWDEQKHWRTTTTLGWRLSEENGGGYSDYTRWSAALKVHYDVKRWEVTAEGRLNRYEYATQTVSATSPGLRVRTDWAAALRVERRLTEHLKAVVSGEHEQTLSNDPLETFSVNTVSGGLHWEF